MVEEKIFKEREACGCNKLSCNYQYKSVDVEEFKDEKTGVLVQKTSKAILFCTYCSHVEELIYEDDGVNASKTP